MHHPIHWGVPGMQERKIWGEEMEHFTTEKWIDFVNAVISADEKELMENHLKEGCNRCMETVSLWQRVRRTAASEGNYQPPENGVRLAKAAFAEAGWAAQGKATGSQVKVLFDSFLQPMFEGARSASVGTRQMLYRADPFQIDVQVEAKLESSRIVITGQLLDLSNPGIIVQGTRVLLSNLRGQQVHTVANEFGEFSGEMDNSGDLQMTFASPGGVPIVISLREALGRLPGEKA